MSPTAVDGEADISRGQPIRQRIRDGWGDRILVVAALLVVADIAWRAWVASGGYLAVDDLNLAEQAVLTGPNLHLLLAQYNNHLQPGGMMAYWAVTHLTGLTYWPYLLPILLGQLIADVVFLRLVLRMFGRAWVALLAFALFAFSPITLEATTWVAVAVLLVPFQLAAVWALSAQERYVATGERRYLVSLGAAFAFGLCFNEKVLLIAPLVALFTVCLYTSGGPVRSVREALRRFWPSFAVLAALALPYLAVYAATSSSPSSLQRPVSVEILLTYVRQILGQNLIAGLFGGPVEWVATGQGTAFADTPTAFVWLSCTLLVALVVITVARRPTAVRAWVMIALYAAMPIGVIAMTRLGTNLAFVMGLQARYVYDIVLVAAIGVGAAIAGVPGQDERVRQLPRWLVSRPARVAGTVVPLVALLAALFSGVGYAHAFWNNSAHRYMSTVRAELAGAPAGAAFVELYVPQDVVWGVRPLEYRRQSNLLAADKGPQPRFVTEGENLLVIDELGHLRAAAVIGRSALPGPSACGWAASGTGDVSIPLDGSPTTPAWAVSIDYQSTADTTATLTFGNVSREFPVLRGSHEYILLIGTLWGAWAAGDDHVELSVRDSAASLCTRALRVGEVAPAQ